ncbi:hypothetical protein BaRGS_00031683, partial [Batillaria attramentaria]
ELRCYCNESGCVSTGYMCKSAAGQCYTAVEVHGEKTRATHGCLDSVPLENRGLCGRDADRGGDAGGRGQGSQGDRGRERERTEVIRSGTAAEPGLGGVLICCAEDMCNYYGENEITLSRNITGSKGLLLQASSALVLMKSVVFSSTPSDYPSLHPIFPVVGDTVSACNENGFSFESTADPAPPFQLINRHHGLCVCETNKGGGGISHWWRHVGDGGGRRRLTRSSLTAMFYQICQVTQSPDHRAECRCHENGRADQATVKHAQRDRLGSPPRGSGGKPHRRDGPTMARQLWWVTIRSHVPRVGPVFKLAVYLALGCNRIRSDGGQRCLLGLFGLVRVVHSKAFNWRWDDRFAVVALKGPVLIGTERELFTCGHSRSGGRGIGDRSGVIYSRNDERHDDDRDLWFKAAVIAVPIAGGFILVLLVLLAVRMLRTDTQRHRRLIQIRRERSLTKAQLYVTDHFSDVSTKSDVGKTCSLFPPKSHNWPRFLAFGLLNAAVLALR